MDRPADSRFKQAGSKGRLWGAGFQVCWESHLDIFAENHLWEFLARACFSVFCTQSYWSAASQPAGLLDEVRGRHALLFQRRRQHREDRFALCRRAGEGFSDSRAGCRKRSSAKTVLSIYTVSKAAVWRCGSLCVFERSVIDFVEQGPRAAPGSFEAGGRISFEDPLSSGQTLTAERGFWILRARRCVRRRRCSRYRGLRLRVRR